MGWLQKNKEKEMGKDIEMARVGVKKGGPPEETDYQSVDWKKFFLTPKYIRM
jgi:hypothetical protein